MGVLLTFQSQIKMIQEIIEFKKIRMKQIALFKTELAIIAEADKDETGTVSERNKRWDKYKHSEKCILECCKSEMFEIYLPDSGVVIECSKEEVFELLGQYPTFNTSEHKTWCTADTYNGYITNHEETVNTFSTPESATHFCGIQIGVWSPVTPCWGYKGTWICRDSKIHWRFIEKVGDNYVIEFCNK